MRRSVELNCGHRKHIKVRSAKWTPVCWECRRRVSPIRVYPMREQIKGEWLEAREAAHV